MEEILRWIEESVIPCYDAFDRGHRRDHARHVLQTALDLARHYDVDPRMVAVAAACHDLGLSLDRKTHHLESGRIIRQMEKLNEWFSRDQIETIAQAAEDHRASATVPPRTIYGMIVAEADRQIIPETVIRRTVQYGIRNFPEMNREQQFDRTVAHLKEKYGPDGYMKLLIPESPNAAGLEQLRSLMEDRERLFRIFCPIFDEESSTGIR